MNPGRWRLVPHAALLGPALVSALLLGGCLGVPDIDSEDPLVVTETGLQPDRESQSFERQAAVAEIREQARRGDALPYPDAFQAAQTTRLAARPEPLAVASIEAIERELADVRRRRQSAVTPAEIAALQAREAELRRLAARTQAAGAAARRNPAGPVLGR